MLAMVRDQQTQKRKTKAEGTTTGRAMDDWLWLAVAGCGWLWLAGWMDGWADGRMGGWADG